VRYEWQSILEKLQGERMAPERHLLEQLAQAVASGHDVDWDAALSTASDSEERCAIEQLRAVDGIAHGGGGAAVAEATLTRAAVAASTTFTAGQTLGERYRIQAFLGRGGMGEVWQAFDLKLRVDVALKSILRHQFADERMLERLRREVRSAREVVSPNVCRIYDLVEIDGNELVSMEYIDGRTLLDLLREQGPLDLGQARAIASQFLAGLEAIHQVGLVHRDVKPENIMITRSGRVVLMDFGLARSDKEGSGTISGTPAYMPPEQLRGESVDARADIFAAGVVLAEMLSADGVRDRDSRGSLHKALHEDPPNIPESPWRAVLERAVSRDADGRYESAGSLNRALEEVALRVEGEEHLRPYPGLASFTEDDAEYFFGREVEVEELWKKLRRPHLMALVGPSGAGKTSFLRAGLLPALPEGWRALICTPGTRPFTNLAQALAREFAGDADAMSDLLRFEEPDVAVAVLRRWRGGGAEGLLIVDQFEELFTLNPPEVQATFAELLGRLSVEADVRVLLSMRDDFLFRCSEQSDLKPVFSELTPLAAISARGLRRTLVQPALKCGYRFEDQSLVDDMVREVAEERGALPLLAFAVGRLWEKRDREQGLLTREAYQEIGGVGGALAQHAEAAIERIGTDRLPIVREIFRNLVTSETTRAVRDREELLSVFDDPATGEEVLSAMIDARLLTSYEWTTGEGEQEQQHHRIEIVHESLLTSWPRLMRWQTQDADAALMRDQFRQAAYLWEERDRPRDLLWTGSSFREFQVWRERYPGGLSSTEISFERAMIEQAGRRRKRRRLAVTSVISLLVVVVVVIGWFWREAGLAAQEAKAEALRAEASKLVALGERGLASYPTGALAYAIKSLEVADTESGRLLALRVLQQAPVARIARVGSGDAEVAYAIKLDLSPNGEWVATGDYTKSGALHRDGERRLVLGEYSSAGDVAPAVRFSPRGDALVADYRGEVGVWSIPEGRELRYGQIDQGWSTLVIGDDDFVTITAVEGRWVFRSWPLGEGEPRLLGTTDPFGGWDAARGMLAFGRGSKLFLQSLESFEAPPRVLAEHPADIGSMALSTDGNVVAAKERSGAIRVWATASPHGAPLRVFEGDEELNNLWFRHQSRWLAETGNKDGHPTIQLWDLEALQGAAPITLRRGDAVFMNEVAFDSGGHWLATGHADSVSLWWLGGDYPRVFGGQGGSHDLVFTPDGRSLVSTSTDGTVRLWPLVAGSAAEPRILLRGGVSSAPGIAIDPRGQYVAVSGARGRIHLVPLDGSPATQLEGFSNRVVLHAIAFGADGRLVAAAPCIGPAEEKVIRVFDLETGAVQVLGPLPGTQEGWGVIQPVHFVGPDHILAGVWGTGIVSLDLKTGAASVLASWPAAGVYFNHAFTGGVGVTTTHPDATLTDPAFLEPIRFRLDGTAPEALRSRGPGSLFVSAAFDPSDRLLATTSEDGIIRVGPESGAEPHLLFGHTGRVLSIVFSPDGRLLASGGADGTIRLWSVPDVSKPPLHTLPLAELLAKLRTHTNLRAVPDPASPTGYKLEVGPFPGWAKPPEW